MASGTGGLILNFFFWGGGRNFTGGPRPPWPPLETPLYVVCEMTIVAISIMQWMVFLNGLLTNWAVTRENAPFLLPQKLQSKVSRCDVFMGNYKILHEARTFRILHTKNYEYWFRFRHRCWLKTQRRRLEASEMWIGRRMERISWIHKVINEVHWLIGVQQHFQHKQVTSWHRITNYIM